MHKGELISRVRARVWSKKRSYGYYIYSHNDPHTELVINAFIEEIVEAVENGETVTITGFGTFSPRYRNARLGTNPQTKAAIQIQSHRAPGFRPGAIFKRRVRGQ